MVSGAHGTATTKDGHRNEETGKGKQETTEHSYEAGRSK
jgi:hypothetical protein